MEVIITVGRVCTTHGFTIKTYHTAINVRKKSPEVANSSLFISKCLVVDGKDGNLGQQLTSVSYYPNL